MWICPNCSMDNQDASSFCTECGCRRPMETVPAETTQPPQPETTWNPEPAPAWNPAPDGAWNPAPEPKKKNKLLLPLAIGGGVLALAVIGLVLFLVLGRTPLFRLTNYHYDTWYDYTFEERYYYTKDGGRLETYEDGKMEHHSTLILNKQGLVQTEMYYDANDKLISRLEYEYDKYGNEISFTNFSPEGRVRLTITRVYNKYRVIEHQETIYYNTDGSVDETIIVDYPTPERGSRYTVSANGSTTVEYTYERKYVNNQLVEEIAYDEDGDLWSTRTYVRDKYNNVISATLRYYDGDEVHYYYEYERVR